MQPKKKKKKNNNNNSKNQYVFNQSRCRNDGCRSKQNLTKLTFIIGFVIAILSLWNMTTSMMLLHNSDFRAIEDRHIGSFTGNKVVTIYNETTINQEHDVSVKYGVDAKEEEEDYYGLISEAAQCYYRLQRLKQTWILQWLQEQVPILDAILLQPKSSSTNAAVTLAHDTIYQISMIVKHLPRSSSKQQNKHRLENVLWYCNDNIPATWIVNHPKAPVHLIECRIPHQYHSKSDTSSQAQSQSSPALYKLWSPQENRVIEYTQDQLGAFIECDLLELTETQRTKSQMTHSASTSDSRTSPSIGACVIEQNVDVIEWKRWVHYHHHLLGITHFWLYLNEQIQDSWKAALQNMVTEGDAKQGSYDFTSSPSSSQLILSVIPYNYVWNESHREAARLYYRKPKFDIFWQEAMQMKCLYHAKRMSYLQNSENSSKTMMIDWLTTTDLDEYIWINDTTKRDLPHNGQQKKLDDTRKHRPLLQGLIQDNVEAFSQYAGLTMNSVFFGRHPKLEPQELEHDSSRFWTEYTWRHEVPKWQRFKQIYNVRLVQAAEVHMAKGGGPTLPLWPGFNITTRTTTMINQSGTNIRTEPAPVVYLQHYKKANQRVAKTRPNDILIKDPRLRDIMHLSEAPTEIS